MSQPEWIVSSEELARLLKENSKNIVLIDVREKEEREQGFIEGSVLIPLGLLSTEASQLSIKEESQIITYCAHGMRSLEAIMTLRTLGFKNRIRSLEGGFEAWQQKN